MRVDLGMLVLHMAANMVWVGSLLAAVVVAKIREGPRQTAAGAGLRVYRLLAVPGFVGSFVFGLTRLLLDCGYYMVTTHFMHLKLALAAIAIGAHHVIGARLRRGAGSAMPADTRLPLTATIFVLSCLGAVAVAVIKPF